MKRFVICIICMLSFCTFVSAAKAVELEEISDFDVIIAGQKCDIVQTPLICGRDGWYVSLRAAATLLGVSKEDFEWISQSGEVVFLYDGHVVSAAVGSPVAGVDNEDVVLQTYPLLYKGTMYAPFDFFEKALGCVIVWDSTNDKVYFQKESNYNQIYKILSEAITADPREDTRLEYKYETYAVMSDAENGYIIERQERNGEVKYLFKTGECFEKRIVEKLNREFLFENHYRAGKFYVTGLYGRQQEKDTEKRRAFVNQMLNSAHLMQGETWVFNIPVASESNSFNLGEMEKYALTLSIDRKGDKIYVSGSLPDETVYYCVNASSGKLLEERKTKISERIINGINVIVESGWKCKFNSL